MGLYDIEGSSRFNCRRKAEDDRGDSLFADG
jgi:hypothetical protein